MSNKSDNNQASTDNRANQKNPNHQSSKGNENPPSQAERDNRANQLNPNNPEYKGDKK